MDKSLLDEEALDNIQELADHLKTVALSLKSNYFDADVVKFGMRHFVNEAKFTQDNVCHSSACAVGHFAVMRGYEYNHDGIGSIDDDDFVDWSDFSEDYIGISQSGDQEIIWDWLFSCRWSELDDKPLGAAARIEYFLEHGVPKDFYTSPTLTDAENAITWHRQYSDHTISYYLPRRQALEAECLAAKEALDITDGVTHG